MELNIPEMKLINEPILLVVDDEEMQEILMKNVFISRSIKAVFVQSGQECLDFIKTQENIVMILLDLVMPDMNGFETMLKIKDISPAIPVIATSASASSNDREEALRMGFKDILLKPLRINAIIEHFEVYANIRLEDLDLDLDLDNGSAVKGERMLRHMCHSQEDLELGLKSGNVAKVRDALHSIRENPLTGSMEILTSQIEGIQIEMSKSEFNTCSLIVLNRFLKQVIDCEKDEFESKYA